MAMTPRATVTLRFYEELNDFLTPQRRRRDIERPIFLAPAVKDVIEAEGVPHTEVDLILVNGESVGFGHRLAAGDRVAVYPVFEGLDISPLQRLRPRPLREPRFVVDVHLGTLARRLRLLGFDCAYASHRDDGEIVAIGRREGRIVLTRDVGLLKQGGVTHGYWLRSRDPEGQVAEVMGRFDLAGAARPFTRCMVCNGLLERVGCSAAAGHVPPHILERFTSFLHCPDCGRFYWEGSHHAALARWTRRVLDGAATEPPAS